ncbi:MAG TPA: adenosylcobinamide-GDP ribazoletransferase [Geminicoccaceae bacterium]
MLADLVHDCKVALAFLTRLPVAPEPAAHGASLAASVVMFPVVGALIGLLGGVAYALASLGLPPWPAATVALATTIWLTGALHEDGLADVADGFGGGRTREDKLRIMRDSRIGSYGALALVLALLARAGALAALAMPTEVAAALVAAGAVSRAALAPVMTMLPAARADGLAAGAGRPHALRAGAAVLVAALIAVAVLGEAAGPALLAGAGAAFGVAWLAGRQIGGHSGDVLGAVQQLTEIGVLLGALAALRA